MEENTGNRRVIGIAEFARELGIAVPTARRWAYGRRITTVKLGKLLCVPVTEIDRVIAEGTTPALLERK